MAGLLNPTLLFKGAHRITPFFCRAVQSHSTRSIRGLNHLFFNELDRLRPRPSCAKVTHRYSKSIINLSLSVNRARNDE